MKHPASRLAAALASLVASTLVVASAAADSSTPAEQLKELNDPTILKSRAWLDYEWNEYEDGVADGKLTLGALWGLRVTDKLDWGFRLKVPCAWHYAGDTLGDTDESGLGDIEVATGGAYHLSDKWRTGLGLELHADSTTHHLLGDDVWRLKPFWVLAWDAADWLNFALSVEHNDSFREREGVPTQHYTEFFLPVTFILPHSWALSAQYKGKIDYETNDMWSHTVKLGVAKRLEKIPLSLAVSVEKELDGGSKEVQANFVVTWFFQ